MKKRTAFIGLILTLISFGKPLFFKTGLFLSTTGLILSIPQKVYARDYSYYFNSAFKKGKRGDYYGAISDFTKAIEINPSEAAYYNRGWNKQKLEDYNGAIADYTKAIEINTKYTSAYLNRGIAKRKLEDYYGAINDYTKAIEINPNDGDAYYNRGNSKNDIKDYDGAI